MKTKEEVIREDKERRAREAQALLAKRKGERSPNQQRLFEKMGMIVKVGKPPET